MKYLSRTCPEIFKNSFSLSLLIVNFAVCAFLLDWHKTIFYIEHFNANNCQPVSEKISFGFYDISASSLDLAYILLDFIFYIFQLIRFCFFLPSALATDVFMSDLKAKYYNWCPETYDFIAIFTFVALNSLYWMLLGYFIETAQQTHRKNNSLQEKPLGIRMNSD